MKGAGGIKDRILQGMQGIARLLLHKSCASRARYLAQRSLCSENGDAAYQSFSTLTGQGFDSSHWKLHSRRRLTANPGRPSRSTPATGGLKGLCKEQLSYLLGGRAPKLLSSVRHLGIWSIRFMLEQSRDQDFKVESSLAAQLLVVK